MGLSTFLALQADALQAARQIDAGLYPIEEGLRISALHDEVYYDAELHRTKGELLLQGKLRDAKDAMRQAEVCFLGAARIDRKEKLKSHEPARR
jgi:hypothetical protein